MVTHTMKNVAHPFAAVGTLATTVRLSSRWFTVEPGELLALWECAEPHLNACELGVCRPHGLAQVVGRWIGPLGSIPDALLAIEHEAEARTLAGLMASLERGYGYALHPDQPCAVVLYIREV